LCKITTIVLVLTTASSTGTMFLTTDLPVV
jgi:hypothetical protein